MIKCRVGADVVERTLLGAAKTLVCEGWLATIARLTAIFSRNGVLTGAGTVAWLGIVFGSIFEVSFGFT